VALERGNGALPPEELLHPAVDVGGRNTRPQALPHQGVGLGNDAAGLAHGGDFGFRLENDQESPPARHWSPKRSRPARMSASTSETSRHPSTCTRRSSAR